MAVIALFGVLSAAAVGAVRGPTYPDIVTWLGLPQLELLVPDPAGVVVERRRSRLGRDVGEDTAVELLRGIAEVGEDRDARRPARREPVDRHRLDGRTELVDLDDQCCDLAF